MSVMHKQEIFKWGIRISTESDLKVYRSFTYLGVQYSRFDTVYMYRDGAKETDIGKLLKIWESKNGGRRGKILWFFRPIDICEFVGGYEPSWNELFLASGEGKGVSNIIPLDNIVGKCNVVYLSKDSKNANSELRKGSYFFSHTFDVRDLRISDQFPDSIEAIKVERLFNWNQDKPKANVQVSIKPEEPEHNISEVQPLTKRKILPVAEADSCSLSKNPGRWFSKLPWEERIKIAHESGTLVHLHNLDPSHTSSDVQDIISSAFKVNADAKIISRLPFHNPSYGQALVIFKLKEDADFVKFELKEKCLMVGEGRPLIACKSALREPGKTSNFPGHLVMDSSLKVRIVKRRAVSTSHCTQENTVEHDMAIQWRILQKRIDLWWEALHKKQARESSDYM